MTGFYPLRRRTGIHPAEFSHGLDRLARVGMRAAHLVFSRLRGRWEVPVAAYNQEALLFWRSVVRSLPVTIEEHAGDGQRWAGPVLCFNTGAG